MKIEMTTKPGEYLKAAKFAAKSSSPMIGVDPRGPMRKIIRVEGIETPITDALHGAGMTYRVVVNLDCGHECKPNPTFTYRVGDIYRCLVCRAEGRE